MGVREEIRTPTISRHPLKVVRLPISPPGQFKRDPNLIIYSVTFAIKVMVRSSAKVRLLLPTP